MPRKTPTGRCRVPLGPGSFNEAAARCRGKRVQGWSKDRAACGGFNEAAARCRGKPAQEEAG